MNFVFYSYKSLLSSDYETGLKLLITTAHLGR